jgi:leucyl aminopeptidase (aminopeptidase T)
VLFIKEDEITMTVSEAEEAAKGMTFEKAWVAIERLSRLQEETARQMKERQEETDRWLKERQEETDRRMKERQEETDRRIKERQEETDRRIKEVQEETSRHISRLSKNIGGVNKSLGKWAEAMISAKLWEKFTARYGFTHGGPHKYWEDGRTVCQVDMLLENGDYAMPVEIKSTLMEEDVDEHLERIKKVREQLDKRGDQRKLVGAVAGMVVAENVRDYAQKKGLYVLVQSGDTVEVAEGPETFEPRKW